MNAEIAALGSGVFTDSVQTQRNKALHSPSCPQELFRDTSLLSLTTLFFSRAFDNLPNWVKIFGEYFGRHDVV